LLKNNFNPAWWLPGPHFQTLWASLVCPKIDLDICWEQFELPDGDFLDLAWVGKGKGPIILVLTGLTGNIHSSYVKRILKSVAQHDFRAVLMHFRGCSGVPNRLPRSYHAGETRDLQAVIDALKQREPNTPILAVGYSLGGNVLLKWLGETAERNPLIGAVAVSVPFEVGRSAKHLNTGFARFYQWKLLRNLCAAYTKKFKSLSPKIAPVDIKPLRTIVEFDEAVTAPLHGFKNAADYYKKSSSRQFLSNIHIPTLILHAYDDPFTPLSSLPDDFEVSPMVSLSYSFKGGHVGFISGTYPWQPQFWLDETIMEYVKQRFELGSFSYPK
jgi:predicted alpha/beta-fold hydrolase